MEEAEVDLSVQQRYMLQLQQFVPLFSSTYFKTEQRTVACTAIVRSDLELVRSDLELVLIALALDDKPIPPILRQVFQEVLRREIKGRLGNHGSVFPVLPAETLYKGFVVTWKVTCVVSDSDWAELR